VRKRKRVPSASDIIGIPKTKNILDVGLPNLYPSSQPRKDSRRSFGSDQKKAILAQQDNKCASALCHHKKLDPREIHFHHAKPWSSGGRTTVKNGRALCASCHEILSHGERLKKTDRKREKREPSLSLF
jgi:hypothetical protein